MRAAPRSCSASCTTRIFSSVRVGRGTRTPLERWPNLQIFGGKIRDSPTRTWSRVSLRRFTGHQLAGCLHGGRLTTRRHHRHVAALTPDLRCVLAVPPADCVWGGVRPMRARTTRECTHRKPTTYLPGGRCAGTTTASTMAGISLVLMSLPGGVSHPPGNSPWKHGWYPQHVSLHPVGGGNVGPFSQPIPSKPALIEPSHAGIGLRVQVDLPRTNSDVV